jgi:tryptophan synthase beta chain
MLRDAGRAEYLACSDHDALEACRRLARTEGIIPALESAHAVAEAIRRAPQAKGELFIVNVSGRGDKDMEIIQRELGL